MKVPKKYVPDSLTEKQKKKQLESIKKEKERPKLKGVRTRRSKWTMMAHKYFGESPSLQDIKKKLGLKSIRGLNAIIKKGEGAYYSSGSRPNTNAEQWGRARLYSVLFGGPSRKVDKTEVEKYDLPLLKI